MLGYEQFVTNKSKFVFLFEDGEIYDLDDNIKDFTFKSVNGYLGFMPIYFEKNIKNKNVFNHVYFYKDPVLNENNKKSLNFTSLFSSYTKYNRFMNMESYYNSIYYCHTSSGNPEIFGIPRIKSNETMPRFQFAYESDEFTHLIHHMFISTIK